MALSKKFRATTSLFAVLVPLAALSLGSGSSDSAPSSDSKEADPLGGANAKLVGEWSGDGAVVHIGADRSFSFESKQGATSKKYTGKVKRVEANKIVVDAFVDLDMIVQQMPTDVNGATTMTIEGIQVYKGGLIGNLNALITEKFKANGFTKTVCPPTVTAETKTFECDSTVAAANGTKNLKVAVTLKGPGSYDFNIKSQGYAAPKIAELLPGQIKPMAVANVDCGKGTIYVNVGETFECKGVDARSRKNVKIAVTSAPNDRFDFKVVTL